MHCDVDRIVVARISNGDKVGLNFNDNSANLLNICSMIMVKCVRADENTVKNNYPIDKNVM